MSELARRVAFAVVAAPLAVAIVWMGGLPLALLLAAVSAGAAWELYRIARATGVDALDAVGIPLAAAIPLAVHARQIGLPAVPVSVGAVIFIGIVGAVIWARGTVGRPLAVAAVTVFGVLYAGGLLSFGYLLRYHRFAVGAAAGTAVVGLPLVLTWASDIGAYFVGRAIGGRKLIPSVSPGKTVAGAVGGLLATMLVSLLYVNFVLRPYANLTLAPWSALLFGAAISVAAQIGDLAESLLKREAGVKDSSHLIPGHGGVLDRLDSLFFVLPVAYLLLDQFRLLVPVPR